MIAMNEDQQKKIEVWTEKFWKDLQSYFNLPMPVPKITWDLKGLCAGKATRTLVRMNLQLWEHSEDEVYQTLGHELCHSAVAIHHLRMVFTQPWPSSHGKEWKDAMRAIGLPPVRCHSLNFRKANNKERLNTIHCPGCGTDHQASTIVLNRIFHDTYTYVCRKCRTRFTKNDLVYASEPDDTSTKFVGLEKDVDRMMKEGLSDMEMLAHLMIGKWAGKDRWWCVYRLRDYKKAVHRKRRNMS